MIKKILLILFFSITLVSCMEVESSLRIQNDGSGSWSLRYRIYQEAVYLTPGMEFTGYGFLPANAEDMNKRVSEIDGLELLSVAEDTNARYLEYTAELTFIDTAAIESFFNNYSRPDFLDISMDEEGVFVLGINRLTDEEINPEILDIFKSIYSTNSIELSITLPGIVTDSSGGLLSDDINTVNMKISLTDIMTMTGAYKWTVTYARE